MLLNVKHDTCPHHIVPLDLLMHFAYTDQNGRIKVRHSTLLSAFERLMFEQCEWPCPPWLSQVQRGVKGEKVLKRKTRFMFRLYISLRVRLCLLFSLCYHVLNPWLDSVSWLSHKAVFWSTPSEALFDLLMSVHQSLSIHSLQLSFCAVL